MNKSQFKYMMSFACPVAPFLLFFALVGLGLVPNSIIVYLPGWSYAIFIGATIGYLLMSIDAIESYDSSRSVQQVSGKERTLLTWKYCCISSVICLVVYIIGYSVMQIFV